MAGAVLLPATGVTVGVVQVARGVMAQPEALVETLRGSQWDEVRWWWSWRVGGRVNTCNAQCTPAHPHTVTSAST